MNIPSQNILLIITFGEQSWIVLTNGTWQAVTDDFIIPDDVTQYTVQLKDIINEDGNIFVFANDDWLAVPNSVVQQVRNTNSQNDETNQTTDTPNEPNQEGDSYFFKIVERNGDEVIASSGFETTSIITTSSDNSTNPHHQPPESTDTFADITVDVIESCSPNGEIYDIVGTVDDVEDGNTVVVTITDTQGNNLTFMTLVVDSAWQILDADLTGLVDGELIVVANTTDFSGNSATDTTEFIKDTLAEITISVEDGSDNINDDEVDSVNISGTVNGVEDNQEVTVTVSDDSNTLTFTTTVVNGVWVLNDVDLSSLVDGELTYTATVSDLNCNDAEAVTTNIKDTQAVITISVDTNADTIDNVINKVESTQVTIFGTVDNIEDGQTATLAVSDGINTLYFDTTIDAGTWQVIEDLSSLDDGTLTYTVNAVDIAGNPATAETTTGKDTLASITVVINSGDDDYLTPEEMQPLEVSGVVTNVEVGQIITVTLIDEAGLERNVTTTVNEDLTWQASANVGYIDDEGNYISDFQDGSVTVQATVSDLAGNKAIADDYTLLDTTNGITIFVDTFEDTFDQVINAAEASQVDISGLVRNVDIGQTITVTVSDGDNSTDDLTFTTQVTGDVLSEWRIEDADLSTLTDGDLTFTATVTDLGGNSSEATTTKLKDTQAEITISIDTNEDTEDNVINAAEQNQVDISGTAINIEDGQTVNVTVTDGNTTLSFNSIIANGIWQIEETDLSSLVDGTLTYTANVIDIAGNPATVETTTGKDTQAEITVVIDSGSDDYLIPEEMQPLEVSGTVTNVEAGQTITVTLIDEAGLARSVTTTVNEDLTWQASANVGSIDADGNYISDFQDGSVTVQATVSDLAGNQAIAEDYTLLDTTNGITIFVNTFEDTFDQVINAAEATQVDISGLVRNVETGQTITVTVSDGDNSTDDLIFTTLVTGDVVSEWRIEDADLSTLTDGDLTFTATVTDLGGNSSQASTSKLKDTQAEITINVDTNEDTTDNAINAVEQNQVTISGAVNNIEDGQEITLTISDGINTETYNSLITLGVWQLENIDLSSFNEGTLTYSVDTTDIAGNPANATTTTIKDTQAEITISVDTNEDTTDNVINLAESTQVAISGTTTNIEDGQAVHLTVTDGTTTLSFDTTISGDTWLVDNADLSSLADGTLTYTVDAIDVAGNPATAETTTGKDTQATITVVIDSGNDDYLIPEEMQPLEVSGTVTNVEAGQTITVTLIDEAGLERSVTTTVNEDLTWQASANVGYIDGDGNYVSDFQDGSVTVQASVSDIAGNEAIANDYTLLDTTNGITIFVDTFEDTFDQVINAAEASQVDISGLVRNVETGQTITVTVSDGDNSTDDLTFTTEVTGDVLSEWRIENADLSTLTDGDLTFTAQVTDLGGNSSQASTIKLKDTQAQITINVDTNEDTADNVINAAEQNQVDISGTVTNIEDGQDVKVTITDGTKTISIDSVIVSGVWQIDDADLSSLSDGTLTYSVTAIDVAGNPATASTTTIKDSNAEITINVNTNEDVTDNTVNAAEQNQVDISGIVTNIENGQSVTLTITDGTNSLISNAIVTAGAWQVDDVNLSSLNDGTLTYSVEVNDLAGNPATASTTTIKDTQAAITIDVDTNADTADNVINAVESTGVVISGTVTNVEDGQTVTVEVTDDTDTLTFNAVINAGTWQTVADLSSLADGTLNYSATVTDVAGNPADAATTSEKDTQASITIVVNSNADTSDNVINAAEQNQVDISGTVTNIEDNQAITLTVTDGTNTLTFNTTTNAGIWQVTEDLSSLTDGTLTYAVEVIDVAGNPATANTTTTKDTQAEITIEVNTNEDTTDNIINALESTQVAISGTVTNIEDGQTVNLTVTDGTNTLTFNTTTDAGIWQVTEDLSSLTDGTLTYAVEVIDVVGNPANANTTTTKDTKANITIEVDTNADTTDDTINKVESTEVNIFGATTNIEPGQTVTLTVTDGSNTLTFEALVGAINANSWLVKNADLSSLTDGELTYTVDVIDVAGNPASATTTTNKDSQAAISISVNTNEDTVDNIINAAEQNQVVISGAVTNIEDGQDVTLTVTDGTTTLSFDSTIDAGTWQVTEDLSSLTDGTLTYTVDAIDIAGNPATAETTTEKDTQASITVVIDSGGDDYLIPEEMQPLEVSGTVTNVEAGQTITVTLIDEAGLERSVTTTVNEDLTWQASANVGYIDGGGNYVSDFQDGSVTVQASVSDIAGNEAIANDYTLLDTTNGITIFVDTFEDTFDQVINAAEVTQVDISGLVRNVDIGQTITVTVSDGDNSTDDLIFTTLVTGDVLSEWRIENADLSTLTDGDLTFTAQVTDLGGNSSQASTTKLKDTQAEITINVDTNEVTTDNVINAAEQNQVTISGTVNNIEDGQTVNVSVTDGNTTLSFNTLILSGAWQIDDADLSSLVDGTLTYTANVIDVAGNPATIETTTLKDTQATITIAVDSNADITDDVINLAESTQVSISGTVTNIEDNQAVILTVTDGTDTLTFNTTVNSGGWQVTEDLSSLVDGTLTYAVEVIDVAGNPATATTSTAKDTQAVITITVDTSEDVADTVINAVESTQVAISGTTSNIEDGQAVTLTVTDGVSTLSFDTTTINNTWQVDAADLSSLADGTLTYSVEVMDVAGNPATTETTTEKDTQASITVVIDSGGDDYLIPEEMQPLEVSGTVTNVEAGQTITVTLIDEAGLERSVTTTVNEDLTWQASANVGYIDGEGNYVSDFQDGSVTVQASVSDLAGNEAIGNDYTLLDTSTGITIFVDTFEDTFDQVINAAEASQTDISGLVRNVETGQTITVTVSDGDNNTDDLIFTTLVTGDVVSEWRIEDADLSTLTDGDLTFTATVSDLGGNSSQASTTKLKDTQAEITINVDTNEDTTDNVINAAEQNQVTISGAVNNIEDGQEVTLTISDGVNTQTYNSLITLGVWQLENIDLSSFNEGTLTYSVDATDIAGNPANATTTTIKDTQATISISVDTNEDTTDNVINLAESTQVAISGTTTNIEDGQAVHLTVTDGTTTLSFDTTISGDTWLVDNADLSSLSDGTLTYNANVTDVAGNPASTDTTTLKDTQATITTVIDSGDDELLLASEISPVKISGTVTNIEIGQTITVLLSNVAGDSTTTTATVAADYTWTASADISSFSDGELTATASVNDIAGNPATSADTATIDTQVAIDIDTGANGLDISEFRANNIDELTGTTDAEIGQAVTVTIFDGTTSKDFVGVVDSANHWLVSGIDITSFDKNKAWQVTASVTDLAGNSATDDMPIIDVVRTNTFYESYVAITGSQAKSHILELNAPAYTKNSDISLSSVQTELAQILSENQSVTVVIAPDGQSLTLVRDSDNALVMKIEIALEATALQVTMFEAVNNPNTLTGILNTAVSIEATQTDEDGTTETVILSSHIEVFDSPPIAVDDNYQVIENEGNLGSFTGNDFTAEGPLIVTSVTIEGTNYLVPDGSSTTINLFYGDLTVNANGSWSFAAGDSFDNTELQTFELTYFIIDDDGSEGSAIATFVIEDGKAGTMTDVKVNNTETTVGTINNDNYQFTIAAGSDSLVSDSINFNAQTLSQLNALALTSNGEALTYTSSNDGKVITAQAGSVVVFTLSLSATNNANDLDATLVYKQVSPLDHINSESFTLPLIISANDLDGTVIESGKVSLTIQDGDNPQFSDIEAITLDEVDLNNGEQTQVGTLSTIIGSDNIVSVIFSNSSAQPKLTAEGVTILYSISADGKSLIGYTDDINTPIFIAQLADNFNETTDTIDAQYSFTLYQTLDQDVTDQIPLSIQVTDFDGDTSSSNLAITIIDDSSAQITTPDLIVSETPVDFSQATNIDLGDIISVAGTDTLVDLDYEVTNGDAVLDNNGNGVTQNGQAITWLNLGDGTLQGVLDSGTVVFSVNVPDTFVPPPAPTEVTFTLQGAVDHLDPQNDSLTVLVPMVLIDQDGTHIVQNMNVQIDDGLNPSIVEAGSADLVDESLLLDNDKVSVTGSYNINSGSDQVVSVMIADDYVFSDITIRDGVNVTLNATPSSDGWYVARADDDNSEVFRIRFNTNNTFDYRQSQALDHELGDGENQLTLTFDIQAIDADGDKSEVQSLTVDVKDDTPQEVNTDIEFAEGDIIPLDLLTPADLGADGAVVSTVTYLGVNYAPGDIITLQDGESGADAESYGTIVINADGTGTINSVRFEYPEDILQDNLTYDVTDLDGDTVTNTIQLSVRDGSGVVVAVPLTTAEDTPVELQIYANPGDIDNGETITEIRINIASLNGGTLQLDNNDLTIDGNDYVLSGAQLTEVDFDYEGKTYSVITANGALEYTPSLNTSDAIAMQQVTIDVGVQIEESDGTLKPLISSTIDITIDSVADLPPWDDANSTYEYNQVFDGSVTEDGAPVALALKADLFDTDGSEVLTFTIDNIDSDLLLSYQDGGQSVSVTNGSIISQAQLNSLSANTVLNSAGLMTFTIKAVATEQDNSDIAEQPEKLITLNVQAVADKPSLTVKNIFSDEDVAINVNDIISGQLLDTDGSETLSFELTLPDNWSLNGLNGATVTDLGNNVWSVSASDVGANNIELIPEEDVSSVNGTFTIDVQSVAADSPSDGVPVYGDVSKSDSKTLTVTLKGVTDVPTVEDNPSWSFDTDTLTISNTATFYEDSLIPLDFSIVTSDNDLSEIISLTITDLPEGVSIVDVDGNDAELPVVGFQNELAIYSVTAEQLQTLYLKADHDFSGNILLSINAITTEADGASGEYPITLDIHLFPIIDETSESLATSKTGIEDKTIVINFKTNLTADDDGSEEVTGAVITSIPADATLTLDGSAYSFTGNLDLATLATTLNVSLIDLLNSGRLGLVAPEDATGTYSIGIDYTIIDTDVDGDISTDTFSTTSEVIVTAEVDDLTRFEVADTDLVSSDGSAIDLTGVVGFTDDDLDGSEVLDYLVLVLPSGDNWLVTHPNGALPNGKGQWLIPIDSDLTSDTVQEDNKDILAGVTILSSEPTNGPVTVTLYGRVLDETDVAVIFTEFNVEFDAAINSTASAVQILQTSPVDGIEDETVTFADHLNTDIAGDNNDLITFSILASDLPEGTSLSGTDVRPLHLIDGVTVNEYLFTEASLADLTLSSAGKDFSGVYNIPITIIATDSLSGDTLIDNAQELTLDIAPVVDGITITGETLMLEDVPESLDVNISFLDADVLPELGGQEAIQVSDNADSNFTVTLLDGGEVIDSSGYFVLKDGTTDTWQFTGNTAEQLQSALSTLRVQPPEHISGTGVFTAQLSGYIADTTIMLAGTVTDTQAFSKIITIDIDAVTDPANLNTSYSEGDEDTPIDLSSLSAQLIDQDGSEFIDLTIEGVPEDAIIAIDNGSGTLVHLPNNGVDGGSFNGKPTYSWTVTQDQLSSLVLLPPLDFNGDIPLTLQAITKDQAPGEFVTTTSDFIVGVNPISDGVDVFTVPDALYSESENNTITIDLGAITADTNADEQIQLTVHLNASSDASALVDIDSIASIQVDGQSATFADDGAGGYISTLTLNSNEMSSFDLQLGYLAWGTFNMTVDVASLDSATVNGNTVTDTSPVESFNFDIELTPEVDAPLWGNYGDVSVTDADNIPLNLELTLQNPAPSETGSLLISGLLTGHSLNYGEQQGDDWLVDIADVENLEIIGAQLGDNFDLTLTPYAELNAETETGTVQTINVEVGNISASSFTSSFSSTGFSSMSAPEFSFDENAVTAESNSFVNALLDDMANQTQGMDT
ncbi:hypothetical protein [Colwellia sp. E2M01]|uniref:T1SS-143 repeat domain-containing protein n=1 Tax=Colwellia sp. E2M01 TaxID=2841561 RepID=UPI001C0A2641|nr:hypothetical protein [Colwellia sp. E2M01]MBU2871314.1 hypothetical protein [Colwellia sp. E2M01]